MNQTKRKVQDSLLKGVRIQERMREVSILKVIDTSEIYSTRELVSANAKSG
jgi:hypothetical protein